MGRALGHKQRCKQNTRKGVVETGERYARLSQYQRMSLLF